MISIESMATTKYATQGGMSARSALAMLSAALWSLHLRKAQMAKRIEVKRGDRYGQLTVIEEAEPIRTLDGHCQRLVLCRCFCGNTTSVRLVALRRTKNNTTSCGCLTGKTITHGWSAHPLYRVWTCMKRRCDDPSDRKYQDYGGRGISVCQEWYTMQTFIDWALANGWAKGLQIDRRENNGNYTPDNCRFVTQSVNMRNTRNNHLITFNGETLCLSAWAEKTGIGIQVLNQRINIKNWPVERALTEPVQPRRARS